MKEFWMHDSTGAVVESSLRPSSRHYNCTKIILKDKLTAALAERDEARERVKELEAQATAPGYPYQTLKGMVASLEGCNQRQADTIRQYKSQLDTAWQQGAEVMREAAMHVCAPYTHGQWFMEAIRALPVPERKEG